MNRQLQVYTSVLKSYLTRSPIWVCIYLTRRCNANCSYCWVNKPDTQALKSQEMSTHEIFQCIDKIKKWGCNLIVLMGGEPLLRNDLKAIVAYIKSKKMACALVSNGILLTKQKIESLGRAGANALALSIDSLSDFGVSQKNLANSQQVLKNLIELGNKCGYEVVVNVVMTRKNIQDILELVDQLNKLGVTSSIQTAYEDPNFIAPPDKSILFKYGDKETLFKVIDQLVQRKKKGYKIKTPIAEFRAMQEYITGIRTFRCTSGWKNFTIGYDGRVQLCCNLDPWPEKFLDIDKDYFKHMAVKIKQQKQKCQKVCMADFAFEMDYYSRNIFRLLKK